MAKILISMPDEFLTRIDGFADKECCTRSELIRIALRNYMRSTNRLTSDVANNNAKLLEDMLS